MIQARYYSYTTITTKKFQTGQKPQRSKVC
jgi:hypothetical protein